MNKDYMDPHACNRLIASIILTAVKTKDVEWFDTPKARELLSVQTLLPDNPEYYKLRIRQKHKPLKKPADTKPFRPFNRTFWTNEKIDFVRAIKAQSIRVFGKLDMHYVATIVNGEFDTDFNNRVLNKLNKYFKEWYHD